MSETGTWRRFEVAEDAAGPGQNARDEQARILNRLARIEGQVRGVQRMIEEGKDCEQTLTQLAAIRSALDQVGIHLISSRMQECLECEMEVAVDPEVMEKAFEIFFKYVRCIK
jgi:CsoR family transcriptional regulator, copper-sensing transcriptional repressor